ncbi:rhomboid-like protein [Streptomyces sp. NPDC047017]|uniref:rhomboid-like protein n=1 Tax=Streptomyces sp. NPDC047017 TaxID=3155024 RepID=UPI0033FE3E3A
MERTAQAGVEAAPLPEAMPRQRPGEEPVAAAGEQAVIASGAAASRALAPALAVRLRALRPGQLLPTPAGTPFTFTYAVLLTLTSLITRYAPAPLVDAFYRGSSTDVAHLVRSPLLVLSASALWVAGGIVSPYSLCFLLVLTALERRAGGLRTAGVFVFGHVCATLATEVPVGLAVLAGRLPDSALHRLDYGISFGVAASVGALSGLLGPWLRWPLLAGFGGMVLADLCTTTDPMTGAGHLISVLLGVASWPVLRRGLRPLR